MKKLRKLYERTMSNCQFYEREGKQAHLLNEIGVLRGIAYCMEAFGEPPFQDPEFLRLISLQENFKKNSST